jgi:type I restriction enzyme S subunit
MTDNENGHLPQGWVGTTLGEVVNPSHPKESPTSYPNLPFIGMEHVEAHSMRLIGTVPARTMKSNAVHFFPNDVLYGRLRPYLNKVYRPDFEGLCSAEFIVFPASEYLNAKFLQYFLNSTDFVSFASRLNEGDRPRVDFTQLTKYAFPLPPLSEQARIVAKVEELLTQVDAGVNELRRAQTHLKRYRQAVLKQAVTGELTNEWRKAHTDELEPGSELLARILRERRIKWEKDQFAKMEANGKIPSNDEWKKKYKEPPFPNGSALPAIPDTWIWATIDAISRKVVDGVHKKPNYVPTGIPVVTVKNLTAGPNINFDKLHYVTQEDHLAFINRANPERGDLLVSKDGTLGVTRAIKTDTVFSIFVSVALIKPVLPTMSSYLEIALSSPQVQGQMVPKGSGLQHIHLEDLRLDCIPFGSLEEQEMIVREVERCLSIADAMDKAIQKSIRQADGLRRSILKRAFEGNLVEQDPNEEAAELLLERIKVEHERREAQKDTAAKRNRKGFAKNRTEQPVERPAA